MLLLEFIRRNKFDLTLKKSDILYKISNNTIYNNLKKKKKKKKKERKNANGDENCSETFF